MDVPILGQGGGAGKAPQPQQGTAAGTAGGVVLPYTTIGTWHGKPNYQCAFCRYTSLRLDRMRAHVDEHLQGGTTDGI